MAEHFRALHLMSFLRAELDRLFEETLRFEEASLESGEWYPRVDVVESEAAVTLLAELPGIDPTKLSVRIEQDTVIISGTKSVSPPDVNGARFHCVERASGAFRRIIRIDEAVNILGGKASLHRGLLTIEFPKVAERRRTAAELTVEDIDA